MAVMAPSIRLLAVFYLVVRLSAAPADLQTADIEYVGVINCDDGDVDTGAVTESVKADEPAHSEPETAMQSDATATTDPASDAEEPCTNVVVVPVSDDSNPSTVSVGTDEKSAPAVDFIKKLIQAINAEEKDQNTAVVTEEKKTSATESVSANDAAESGKETSSNVEEPQKEVPVATAETNRDAVDFIKKLVSAIAAETESQNVPEKVEEITIVADESMKGTNPAVEEPSVATLINCDDQVIVPDENKSVVADDPEQGASGVADGMNPADDTVPVVATEPEKESEAIAVEPSNDGSVTAEDKQESTAAIINEPEKESSVIIEEPAVDSVDQDEQEEGKKDYTGYRVYRVTVPTEAAAAWVIKLEDVPGIELWADPKLILRRQRFFATSAADIMVAPDVATYIEEVFTDARLPYEILIEDLQVAIDAENPPESADPDLFNRNGHNMTWDRYHNLDVIDSYLRYIEEQYPDFVTLTTIGYSTEGRAIKAVRLHQDTGRADKKTIYVDAGIHSREWITPATLTYMIKEIIDNPSKYDCLMNEFDWIFVPVINPDGYEFTHKGQRMWRKTKSPPPDLTFRRVAEESLRVERLDWLQNEPNLDDAILEKLRQTLNAQRRSQKLSCTGTDANRNFGYQWMTGGSSRNPCSNTYAGPAPFSEPEAKALSDHIMQNKDDIAMYVSLHSYSQMWLLPWGYTETKPDDYQDLYSLAKIGADALKAIYGTTYIIGSVPDLLYIASGSSVDWAKAVAGIKYSYTLELRDSGKHGFLLPAQYIVPSGKETWAAMYASAQELARRIYPDAARCNALI